MTCFKTRNSRSLALSSCILLSFSWGYTHQCNPKPGNLQTWEQQGNPTSVSVFFCFLFPGYQNCAQQFTDKKCTCNESLPMIISLLAPFLGLGCYRGGKSHAVHLLTASLLFFTVFLSNLIVNVLEIGFIIPSGNPIREIFLNQISQLFHTYYFPILPTSSASLLLSLAFPPIVVMLV